MQKKAQFDDRIRNLIALAQDGSQHSRTLLFSHISDLFLQKRPMASAIQVRMLVEILNELLDQVTLSKRQEIAAALCALTDPPEQLINILCEDVVEVSGPLLEKAILPDEKLIHIIRYGTEAHRIHISRRFGLSPLVRHELEKAYQDSQNSKLKYSLNQLDKLAEDHDPDLDEETTANILEMLRAQNIHDSYPERNMSERNMDITGQPAELPAAESSPTESATVEFPRAAQDDISELSRRATDKIEGKISARIPEEATSEIHPAAAPKQTITKKYDDEAIRQPRSAPYKDQNNIFQPDNVANDASLPYSIPQQDSIIHMSDASSDLADDIWQQVQHTRSETNRQRELVRSIADWFWEVDRTGMISFVSEEAVSIFACPASSLIGEDFISLCTLPAKSEDGPHDPAHDSAAKDETFEFLFERRSSFRDKPFYITPPGGVGNLWYISAIAVFDTHSGRFTGFRGSARSDKNEGNAPESPIKTKDAPVTNMTNLKAYDEEIAAELLQNLSHEFRTPLNAIIGFSEMINMETWGPVNEQYHQNTKNILAAAGQLKEAVNDVLDSAKLEAGLMQIEPESFSLRTVLKSCQENVQHMADEHHVQFEDSSNNIDVILYNDKQSVELCLTKILTSIIKRASGGETIRPSVLINSNAQVRVEIPILGPRIDEKNIDKIFQKLKTEPDEQINFPHESIKYTPKISPGFGLSIARQLANMIGGNIFAHTAQGHVTHLVLTLSNHEPAA